MTLNLSEPHKFTAGQEDLRTNAGREVWVAVWVADGYANVVQTMAFDTREVAEEHMKADHRTRLAVLGPVDREPAP